MWKIHELFERCRDISCYRTFSEAQLSDSQLGCKAADWPPESTKDCTLVQFTASLLRRIHPGPVYTVHMR